MMINCLGQMHREGEMGKFFNEERISSLLPEQEKTASAEDNEKKAMAKFAGMPLEEALNVVKPTVKIASLDEALECL